MKKVFFTTICGVLFGFHIQGRAQVPNFSKSLRDSIYGANLARRIKDTQDDRDSLRKLSALISQDKVNMYEGYTDDMLRRDAAQVFAKYMNDILYAYNMSEEGAKNYLRTQNSAKPDSAYRRIFSSISIWDEKIGKKTASEVQVELLKTQTFVKPLVNVAKLTSLFNSSAASPNGAVRKKLDYLVSYIGEPQILQMAMLVLLFEAQTNSKPKIPSTNPRSKGQGKVLKSQKIGTRAKAK